MRRIWWTHQPDVIKQELSYDGREGQGGGGSSCWPQYCHRHGEQWLHTTTRALLTTKPKHMLRPVLIYLQPPFFIWTQHRARPAVQCDTVSGASQMSQQPELWLQCIFTFLNIHHHWHYYWHYNWHYNWHSRICSLGHWDFGLLATMEFCTLRI